MNLPAKKIFWIFFLLSFSFLIPNLMIPIINYGQLGKQTFVAAMIEGFFQSDTVGWLFPIRHFLEPAHTGPVPWAEEVPLYHYLVVWAMKSIAFAGITANVVILGKFLSMIAWGTLIYGFFRIGKNLNPNDGTLTPWIFALTGAIFPVFRLYAIEVMPDLWMTALCVWAIERALSEKPIASASMILLASLFKYYALFTGFGIALFYLYRSLEKMVQSGSLAFCEKQHHHRILFCGIRTGDRTDQSGKENPKTFTFFTGRLDFIPHPFHRKFCSP